MLVNQTAKQRDEQSELTLSCDLETRTRVVSALILYQTLHRLSVVISESFRPRIESIECPSLRQQLSEIVHNAVSDAGNSNVA